MRNLIFQSSQIISTVNKEVTSLGMLSFVGQLPKDAEKQMYQVW